MTRFRDKYGPWALITGADTGVGAEFARQIAARGLDLVLTASSEEPLHRLADALRQDDGVRVRTVAVHLGQPRFLRALRSATDGIEVGLLINNAGAWFAGGFAENDLQDDDTIVALNLRVPAVLARDFGGRMAARGRGGIVFVGSPVTQSQTPFNRDSAVTGPADLPMGEAFWYELAPHGVDVTGLAVDLEHMDADAGGDERRAVVAEALAKLGQSTSTVPGRMNTMINLMGTWIFSREPGRRTRGALASRAARANLN